MPRLRAVEIKLNDHEKTILTQMKNGTHVELHFKNRAEIILRANSGEGNRYIALTTGIARESVKKWRNRYANAYEELARTAVERPKKLREAIEKVLSDAPRPGAPATFTDEQVACILALACELPENLNLPFSHWTPTLLQQEVIKRGIVESISAVHVGRFLKRGGI